MRHYTTARWLALSPVLVLSTAAFARRPTRENLHVCAASVAMSWVKAHQLELPTTLTELHRFSPTYQRAIYGELSDSIRVKLWNENLLPYLSEKSGLNAEQREFVAHLLARVPDLVGEKAAQRRRNDWKKRSSADGCVNCLAIGIRSSR